jgi:TolB-like protein
VSNELRRLRKELERSESGVGRQAGRAEGASIAVLPFANRSASADDEYFSDGLADELLSVLSKIKGLARHGAHVVVPVQGNEGRRRNHRQEADVATLLEGSVRKAGQPHPRVGAARERGGQLAPVVRDLRPHAGGHLRGAGRHRALGGEGAAHARCWAKRTIRTRAARRRADVARAAKGAAPIPRRTGSTSGAPPDRSTHREDTAKGSSI